MFCLFCSPPTSMHTFCFFFCSSLFGNYIFYEGCPAPDSWSVNPQVQDKNGRAWPGAAPSRTPLKVALAKVILPSTPQKKGAKWIFYCPRIRGSRKRVKDFWCMASWCPEIGHPPCNSSPRSPLSNRAQWEKWGIYLAREGIPLLMFLNMYFLSVLCPPCGEGTGSLRGARPSPMVAVGLCVSRN